MARGRRRPVLILALLSLATLALALKVGSVAIPWADIGRALSGGSDTLTTALVVDLRLPRALNAYATGGLLAIAGLLMQSLLRNPLADPYVLGVSGGAAVAALAAVLLGLASPRPDLAAWAGALVAMLAVLALSRHGRGWTPERLLLTGIVTAAGWSAALGLLLTVASEREVQNFLFWLMGRIRDDRSPLPPLALLLMVSGLGLLLARHLEALARPTAEARALGVPVAGLRLGVYLLASLATAGAVAVAGPVGFVGLLVPHLLRQAGILNQRLLMATAPLLGGSLLLFADVLARTVAAPRELPVGILTALIGAPLLLTLLRRPPAPRAASDTRPASRVLPRPAPFPGLTAHALTLRRGGRLLCRDLSLHIGPGECWAVLGPNGAGKTTLLHALAGLTDPDAGDVCFGSRPLRALPDRERARQLGVLLQDAVEALPLTVLDRVLLGRYPHLPFWRPAGASDQRLASAALQAVDLVALANRPATSLSGGEQRRLALGALLAQNPALYLLDEPTNHLDPRHQLALLARLREQIECTEGAAVLVLHDVNLAARFCTHALLMSGDGDSRIGPAEALLTAESLSDLYGHRLVAVDTPDGRRFLPA